MGDSVKVADGLFMAAGDLGAFVNPALAVIGPVGAAANWDYIPGQISVNIQNVSVDVIHLGTVNTALATNGIEIPQFLSYTFDLSEHAPDIIYVTNVGGAIGNVLIAVAISTATS